MNSRKILGLDHCNMRMRSYNGTELHRKIVLTKNEYRQDLMVDCGGLIDKDDFRTQKFYGHHYQSHSKQC